jgi:hypothetical protein
MRVTNQDFYWGVVTDCDPRYKGDQPRGTFLGGPSGTSQAPHLYLSEGKANRRASPGYSKVVKVRLEIVE